MCSRGEEKEMRIMDLFKKPLLPKDLLVHAEQAVDPQKKVEEAVQKHLTKGDGQVLRGRFSEVSVMSQFSARLSVLVSELQMDVTTVSIGFSDVSSVRGNWLSNVISG